MIKVLFLFIGSSGIPDADGIPQIIIKKLLDQCSIAIWKSITKPVKSFAVTSCLIAKPFPNLADKQLLNLIIWNYKIILIPFCHSPLSQITCCKKHTPQIFYRIIQFTVGQFLSDFFQDCFTSDQALNFFFCLSICQIDKTTHNGISAGIRPVVLRSGIWIST